MALIANAPLSFSPLSVVCSSSPPYSQRLPGGMFATVSSMLWIVAAVYFAWRFFPRRIGRHAPRAPEIHVETTERRSREEWLARAERAAEGGRWAEAVHARYHALTAGLADNDELSPDPSVTSGEHRRAFTTATSDAPDRARRFGDVVERYEQIWFGQDAASPPDVEEAARADDHLLGSPP